MLIFDHPKFLPVFLYQKGFNKFDVWIFGHSKFIPFFLGKIVGKNLERPFSAVLDLYQSFSEKLLEKIQNCHFWPFQIYTSLLKKNCWEKFGTAIFGHYEFIPVFFFFFEKLLEKIQNGHFWKF